MAKVKISEDGIYATFQCPGCKRGHSYTIKLNDLMNKRNHPCWEFNGDINNPTFSPSLLNYASENTPRCHLFIRNGKIEFCGDCEHELKGKIIEMKELENES